MDDTTREMRGEGRSVASTGDYGLRYGVGVAMGVFTILWRINSSH